MLRAYKYRLYPTEAQRVLFAKTFGCCRFVYNWALNLRKELYEDGKRTISRFDLQKKLASELKKEYTWLAETNAQSLQASLINLDTAYKNFFRSPGVTGFPKFKSKHDHQSFQNPQHCKVDFAKGTISIPKAKDIPAVIDRRFNGTVKTVTISMTPSGKYYASVLVDTDIEELPKSPVQADSTIGIDMGVKTLAVCSDGRTFDNPKRLDRSLKRLALLQRRLSKKKKGSANRAKARIKVARLHERIANQRKDNLHKITHRLTHDSQVRTICVENLDVKGMDRDRGLARRVRDASFGEFRRMLEYKCRWYGVNLIAIDRYAPSSKLCHSCGHIYRTLGLNERTWVCPRCGEPHNRDFNAALNIKEIGLQTLPTERGEVKPADCPTMDERLATSLRSRGRLKQEKLPTKGREASAV